MKAILLIPRERTSTSKKEHHPASSSHAENELLCNTCRLKLELLAAIHEAKEEEPPPVEEETLHPDDSLKVLPVELTSFHTNGRNGAAHEISWPVQEVLAHMTKSAAQPAE